TAKLLKPMLAPSAQLVEPPHYTLAIRHSVAEYLALAKLYYRFAHCGAGMMGLTVATFGGYTTIYLPPWICVIRTTCWFCPLASNLTGPNADVLRLMFLSASRPLAGSSDLALLMARAAVSND